MPDSEPKVPVEQGLRAWLEGQGYPSEMQTASAFRQRSFEVRQSYYFKSRTQDTWREADVQAAFVHDVLRREGAGQSAVASLEIGVICECKSSHTPWVMFTRDLDLEVHAWVRTDHRFTTTAAQSLVDLALTNTGKSDELLLCRDPERVGYQLKQSHEKPKEKGRDAAYEGLTKVIDASLAALDEPLTRWVSRWQPCRIVIPVLVIDAPLFECFLSDSGATKLEPANRLTLYWENASTGKHIAPIDVVTLSGLPSYVNDVIALAEYLKHEHEDTIVKVCTSVS